jgi:hypothetical protein
VRQCHPSLAVHQRTSVLLTMHNSLCCCARSYLQNAIGDAQAVICATGASNLLGFGSGSPASVDEKVGSFCWLSSCAFLVLDVAASAAEVETAAGEAATAVLRTAQSRRSEQNCSSPGEVPQW